jgi:hypothetical protein
MTNIAFCIIAPLFVRWSNVMATDIGSLTSASDGHVLKLGNGLKGLRKTWETSHSLLYSRLSSHCAFKRHHSLALSLWTLPLILLVPLISSPLLHSVPHYTRLVFMKRPKCSFTQSHSVNKNNFEPASWQSFWELQYSLSLDQLLRTEFEKKAGCEIKSGAGGV